MNYLLCESAFISVFNRDDIYGCHFCQRKISQLFSLIVILLLRFVFFNRGGCTRLCFGPFIPLFVECSFSVQWILSTHFLDARTSQSC